MEADLNAPMDAPIRAREAREKAEHEAAMEAMRSPEFEANIREIVAGMGKQPPKRGLYNKFRVERMDGSSNPGGKHDGCEYFVLDLTHDKHAKAALLAYADSCNTEYPLLAQDLWRLASVRSKCRHGTPLGEQCADCALTADTEVK